MSATCGDCKWWWSWRHIGENGAGKGECRRFPPVPMPMANSVGGGVDRVTPVTGAHYWCGEHAPQPKETRDEAV